jgi:hypothetical protein
VVNQWKKTEAQLGRMLDLRLIIRVYLPLVSPDGEDLTRKLEGSRTSLSANGDINVSGGGRAYLRDRKWVEMCRELDRFFAEILESALVDGRVAILIRTTPLLPFMESDIESVSVEEHPIWDELFPLLRNLPGLMKVYAPSNEDEDEELALGESLRDVGEGNALQRECF